MAPKRNIWWLGLTLTALLTVAAYAISLNAWWVGDDYNYVRPKGWDAVANFYNPVGRQFYRPLTWSSWALDWALFGAAPLGWRLTSLLMHVSNTLFAALLVRELTGKPRVAILAAALFALHPAATETVTWQGGRADVSFALAWIPALWLWVRWRKGAHAGWWIGAGVLGLISFLGKEAALTLPLASIWIDLTLGRAWPRRVWDDGPRPLRDPPPLVRLLRDHALFLFAAGLYVLMRLLLALTRQGTLGYGEGQLAFLRSFEHAVNVVAGYIFMALGLWWVPQEIVAWTLAAKLAVIGIAVVVGVLLVRWLGRIALFAIGWTAITLLLTLQAVAPRWFYVPALGIGVLIAAIWDRLTSDAARTSNREERRLPRALSFVPLAVLVVWSVLTFVHNELWRQSGEEARRILREVEAVYPASRLPATFYVANPPYSHQGVLLFNSGFDTAMNLVYLDWDRVRAYNMDQHRAQVEAALADPSKLGTNPVFIRYENGHIVPYPSLQALAEADGFAAQP